MWRFSGLGTVVFSVLLTACVMNTPPLYESRARAYLERRGVDEAVIQWLTGGQPLRPADVQILLQYQDTATLFLLASNKSTPADIVEKLAASDDLEVRSGAARNPKLSVDTMARLRTPGKYSTMNDYLARNSSIPLDVLRAMYQSKEAGKESIAMNPSCPPDLVDAILADQPEEVRLWLSFNRGLGPAAWTRLEADPSPSVVRMLQSNPAYVRWKKDQAPREPHRAGG